jgi:uncharacterized protein YbjT (DUF2867 family)
MSTPLLLTGGTGTLGSQVTPLLHEAGHKIRILSRHHHEPADGIEYVRGDLSTGEGVDAALTGAETIVHLAGTQKNDQLKASNLVAAARQAGARHLVYISVVGADRIPVESRADRRMFGYFASKRAAELIVADSGVPWTILRATQFHDLLLTMVQGMAKLPVIPVPAFRFQPVDTREVAAQLIELACREPAGLVPDLGGPKVYRMKELIHSYLHARGKHRLIVPVRMPGQAAHAYRAGANLTPDRAIGQRTWEEFLAECQG